MAAVATPYQTPEVSKTSGLQDYLVAMGLPSVESFTGKTADVESGMLVLTGIMLLARTQA